MWEDESRIMIMSSNKKIPWNRIINSFFLKKGNFMTKIHQWVTQSTKIRKIAQIYYAGMIKPQRLKIKISALVIISTTFPKKCAHFADFSVLRVVHYGLKRRINCNLAEQCIVSYKLLKITVNCSNKLKELIPCFSS